MRTMDSSEVAALTRDGASASGGDPVEALVKSARSEAETLDPVGAMLHADTRIGLPGDMLVKVDRMSMAHGLEVRCPMLDHRVVEAAFAMPAAYKLQAGRGKAVLRDAFADMLPDEVFDRPKRGFEIPIAQWLTGPLREYGRNGRRSEPPPRSGSSENRSAQPLARQTSTPAAAIPRRSSGP